MDGTASVSFSLPLALWCFYLVSALVGAYGQSLGKSELAKGCDCMKKMIALGFTAICILCLFGCSNSNLDNAPTLTGFIQEIHDDHILISTSTSEGYPYGASFDITINIKNCDTIYHPLAVGDEITVYYDGNMTGLDPTQINTVYAITLKTPANQS